MRAGILNEPIEIIKTVITKNSFGEESTEWVTKYKTRARLVHNSGNRAIENSEVVYNYSKTFEVRYYVPIDDFDRIIWKAKTFRVLDITPNKDNQNIKIIAEQVND